MADLDLQTVLNSGNLTSAFFGGTTSADKVAKQSDVDIVNALVTTNTANIATNTTGIATNVTNIATNVTDIAAIDTRVTTLEGLGTYDYETATNITVTNDVYENVLTLTTPVRDAGTYEIRMSQLYTLNSTTTSAYFRFRINGGTYVEVIREPKDNTDLVPMDYWKVLTHAGGTAITVEIEARKENASDVLTIAELNAAVNRK